MSWFNRNGRPSTGRRDDGPAGGLHSRETLLRLLDHERARCDRNGRQFSLVLFDLARVPATGSRTGISPACSPHVCDAPTSVAVSTSNGLR